MTPTPPIHTLSLHDALPIYLESVGWLSNRTWLAHGIHFDDDEVARLGAAGTAVTQDRKSTRLNSSHVAISYAVFCLKKKRNTQSASHMHKETTMHKVGSPRR